MSQGTRFVVEVIGRLNETHEITVSRVKDALGLDEVKAAALVARMPGVITRPAGEERSMRIALSLQAAGVPALHRPLLENETIFRSGERPAAPAPAAEAAPAEADAASWAAALEPSAEVSVITDEEVDDEPAVTVTPLPDPITTSNGDVLAGLDLGHGPAPVAPLGRDPLAGLDTGTALDPSDAPSVDATHHFIPPDPKLTPMTEAGFGAADIMLPVDLPTDLRDTSERLIQPPKRAPRPSLVEAGPTSQPREAAGTVPVARAPRVARDEPSGTTPATDPENLLMTPTDPAATMVRPPSAEPTPVPDGDGMSAAATARAAAQRALRSDRSEAPQRPRDSGGESRQVDPVYRQTRSSAEPALTISPPPDEALKRTGVPETELAAGERRRRGRLARRLAAQVTLPVLLSWGLGAAAIWFLLPAEVRDEHFGSLAAATAVAALIGALWAALATGGVSRDVQLLRDEAKRVAMGELSEPVELQRKDELGDLAQSLDRMRISLQESLERLRKRRS